MNLDNKYLKFPSEEQKKVALDSIIAYFQDERDEAIGYIAAESVLEFFLENFGAEIYKKGLRDANKICHEKLEEIDAEIEFIIGKK